MQRIKTFEEACQRLNLVPEKVLPFPSASDEDQENTNAFVKAKIITKALNEGWAPDWDDRSQRKWFPWFEMGSGFGFSDADCAYWNTLTHAGSRLCFKDEDTAAYAAKQFLEVYRKLLN